MPNVSDLTQSKYLKKEDFPSPKVVTISGYEERDMSKDGAAPEMRWVLNFEELDKPMTLNKTNGNRIAAIAKELYKETNSGDFDSWLGKKIELFNDKSVDFAGEIVGGIRVTYPWNPNRELPKETVEEDDIDANIPF